MVRYYPGDRVVQLLRAKPLALPAAGEDAKAAEATEKEADKKEEGGGKDDKKKDDKKGKKDAKKEAPKTALQLLDTNNDGVLDAAELEAAAKGATEGRSGVVCRFGDDADRVIVEYDEEFNDEEMAEEEESTSSDESSEEDEEYVRASCLASCACATNPPVTWPLPPWFL